MSGIEERVQESKNWLERLLEKTPGTRKYKQKEIRRETDKIQRVHVAEQLDGCLGKLEALKLDLLKGSSMDELGEVDITMRKLRKVRDRIQFADYGYTGMMDPVKAKIPQMDELMAFDKTLEADAQAVAGLVDALTASSPSLQADIRLLGEKLEALDARFDEREQIITGAGR